MTINQEVLEDLAQTTGVDEETLKTVEPDPVVGTPDRFVVEQPVMGTETPITDDIKAKLLNPASQLITIRDNMEKVEDMGDIHDEIASNSMISVDDASRAVTRFEGFENQFHLRSFTKLPSKVNFHLVDGFMKESLKVRQESVCAQAKFFAGAINEAEESFNIYNSFYSVELIKLLTEFQAEVARWKEDPQYLDKQNVYFNEEVNIATCSTKSLYELTISPGSEYNQGAFNDFKALVTSYEENKVKNMFSSAILRAVQHSASVDELIDADQRANVYGAAFNCLDLVEAIGNPYLVQLLTQFEISTKKAFEEFQACEGEANINYSDFKQVRSFITANGACFDKVTAYAHYYAETIDTIRRLFLVASSLLDYFKEEK